MNRELRPGGPMPLWTPTCKPTFGSVDPGCLAQVSRISNGPRKATRDLVELAFVPVMQHYRKQFGGPKPFKSRPESRLAARICRPTCIVGKGQQQLLRGATCRDGVLPDQLDEPVVTAPGGVIFRPVGCLRE